MTVDLWQLAVAGLAAVGGPSVVIAAIWRTGGRIYQIVKDTQSEHAELMKIIPRVEKIEKIISTELTTNGGMSLKDAIIDTRALLAAMDGKFRAFVSTTEMVGWESDKDGNCIWVSPKMVAILGRPPEDIYGQCWRSILHPEDRQRVVQEWQDSISNQRSFTMAYRWISGNGDVIPVTVETFVVRNRNHAAMGYICVAREYEINVDVSKHN